ncbi:MAG: hypothetical protein ICV87_02835 [Gemmatimonadetes bacterium]|nr:hypothetical protein [Gemmatimonadota bacterium]
MHWLRVLLVWGVALGMTAALAWLMVFLGAIDTDYPDPSWQSDLAGGVVFGAATQIGLLLSLWAERRGIAARAVTAVLMLPAVVSLASATTAHTMSAEWQGTALLLVALAVYLVQLRRLATRPIPHTSRTPHDARPADTPVHES